MSNVNTILYDKSVDRAALLRLYEKNSTDKIELLLDGHAIRIDTLIAKNKTKGKNAASFMEAIDKEIKGTFSEIGQVSKRSLLDLVSSQISFGVQNIDAAIGSIWRTERPGSRVSEDIVLNRPIHNDKALMDGWSQISQSERIKISQVIRKGLAEGLTAEEIAVRVRKSNVATITKQQSLGLVRTATTSVVSQADYEVYNANKELLQGWQYVAVLDSRTSTLCSFRNGTIYPIGDTEHLPPAHWNCRSTTTPVVKHYDDLGRLEGISQIRKRNLAVLTPKKIAMLDGQTALQETYTDWLSRQPINVQLRHLGNVDRLEVFRAGELTADKFVNYEGKSIGITELRSITSAGFGVPGDTRRFAFAKEKLDMLKLGAARVDDFYANPELVKNLKEYYVLQAGELDGTLSLTNYRGTLLGNKRSTRERVLHSPPSEDNLKYNPITGRYDDARRFQPNQAVFDNAYKLIDDSKTLKQVDKDFIKKFVNDLDTSLDINTRAVVAENLRIIFGRFRENKEIWGNLKGVIQGQIKFDIMNVSDFIETQIRKDTKLLHKLTQDNYIDPVLGNVQLQDIHDNFIRNIKAKNKWEDKTAPKIAKELRNILDHKIPFKIRNRISDENMQAFYLRFANRLSLADNPERDQLAITLGRDLYNSANYRGSRKEWYELGVKIIDDAQDKGFFKLETLSVQKRRMKSNKSNNYFGPYYDTLSISLRLVDPRIQEYAKLTRLVEVGLRVGVTTDKNRLYIRDGYKTYHTKGLLGYEDTRIPITSTGSFSDFPVDLIDKDLASALNWTAQAKYKVDPEFYDFIKKLMYFADDKGNAEYYNKLNQYRNYITERGDAYERFKAMEWLRNKDASFSNHPFLDHRARIYDRGMIGPQSGETFRPFLSTEKEEFFSVDAYNIFQDQVGSFLGGLSDVLEGKHNSLSVLGRRRIAEKWRSEMINIGNMMRRGKPDDIRKILKSEFMAAIDGEEQGKAFRLALEVAKIDEHLRGNYSAKNLRTLSEYKTALALEQDASSSGAQIIALTTKNKRLAELSNAVPTNQKQRLYDEIASATFNDPVFQKLNQKLGLTEKDLRKAAKAQNMVTFYGAGERTGILNVEGKLAKILSKIDNTLVVKASERDAILEQISARMARYEKYDPELYRELKSLRQDVKDIFNKGLAPGSEIMDQLYFLEPRTRDFVEKLSRTYDTVVTPDDFAIIAKIMSSHLAVEVPILKDFTKFFGRLADEFVTNAKPSDSAIDFVKLAETKTFGERLKAAPKILQRIPGWKEDSTLANLLYGVRQEKLPKKWTHIPWVNFDGKVIEQNFTQTFEEKLLYRNKEGKWVTNIIQVPQKTDPTVWDELLNREDKINDIVDVQKAKTAFAVNGNHSNDATLVKQFHLWGERNGIPTSTIHDAFFTNVTNMLQGRNALRKIYADVLEKNSIVATLKEMRNRGLPKELYKKYLDEATELGLIPVVGKSKIAGRPMTEDDILTASDILAPIDDRLSSNHYWYGVG